MENIKEILKTHRRYFNSDTTKNLKFRIEKLRTLRQAIVDNEAIILEALKKDLNKTEFEAYATEIGFVLDEIRYCIKHLSSWVKPK